MRFISRKKQLRLVLKPTDVVLDEKKHPIIQRGKTIEFFAGRFVTENPELIAELLKDPRRGEQFEAVENVDEFVKAHPQYFSGPEYRMITGAMATKVKTSAAPTDEEVEFVEALDRAGKVIATPAQRPPDLTAIEQMIETKVTQGIEKSMEGMKDYIREILEKAARPRKTFTCPVPGCGQVFSTGVDVGRHKREAHQEQISPTIVESE